VPTIDGLAAHLAGEIAPPPSEARQVAPGPRTERLLGELEQISDADALLALARGERR
jgi:hypothetical protein